MRLRKSADAAGEVFEEPGVGRASEGQTQRRQKKQMKRVEEVESVFQLSASFSVVEGGRDQGQEGARRAEAVQIQEEAAGHKGRNRELSEKIAGRQAADAPDAVISPQQPGRAGEGRQEQKTKDVPFNIRNLQFFHRVQAEKQQQAQKQGQAGILVAGIKQPAVQRQVKGDFSQQSEEQKISYI